MNIYNIFSYIKITSMIISKFENDYLQIFSLINTLYIFLDRRKKNAPNISLKLLLL